jgi:hypothetical protein
MAGKQITLRGLDLELERRLRAAARESGLSMNKAALDLMRRGAGIKGDAPLSQPVGDALDAFIGTWSAADEREVLKAVEVFEIVDEALWR